MSPPQFTRGRTLRERTQVNLFRRRTTDATPATSASESDPATVLRRNTHGAVVENATRKPIVPLERRVPKNFRLEVLNNAATATQAEDTISLITFDSQSTVVNDVQRAKKSAANRFLTMISKKASKPIEQSNTRAEFKELIVFFNSLSDADRVNLGRYFDKPALLRKLVRAGRPQSPPDLRSLAHAVLDRFMDKRDTSHQSSRILSIGLFNSTADYMFFLLEDFEFCTSRYTWPRYVAMLNQGGQMKELIQNLGIVEREPNFRDHPMIDIPRVRETLINVITYTPNAEILDLLSTRNRKLDTLQLSCVNTLSDRYAAGKIQLAELVPTLRKADCFAVFLARSLKTNIALGIEIIHQILDALIEDEERASFIGVARNSTLSSIKGRHGSFVNWIDSLPTSDGMMLSEEAWTILLKLELFMPPSVFRTELLVPLSELYGKQKDHEMLRRYSKLQDVCFQLDRFRKWNLGDELTLHAFMLQSKLQPSLKNFVRQRIAEKATSGNFFSSELAGHIENHYGWSTFVKVLVEQIGSGEQDCGSARTNFGILSHLWNGGPSSVTLMIYDAVYTDWKLRMDGHVGVDSLLTWLTQNSPQCLAFDKYFSETNDADDLSTYIRFCLHRVDLTLIKELIRRSFARDPSLMQQIKTGFTTLRADNMLNTVDFCIAAKSSEPSGGSETGSFSHLGTLRNFIPTELFVEDLTQALSDHGVASERRSVAEAMLMDLHRLTRRTGDYSFILRFFGQTGRLEGDSRICIFDELKERTGTLDERGWGRFFSQVQDTLGWSTFVSILLKEVGDLRETGTRSTRSIAKQLLVECFTNEPPTEAVDVLIERIQDSNMVGYYRAWMSDTIPHLAERLQPLRQSEYNPLPGLPAYSDPASDQLNAPARIPSPSSTHQAPPSYQDENQSNPGQQSMNSLIAQLASLSGSMNIPNSAVPIQFGATDCSSVTVPVTLIALLQNVLGGILQSAGCPSAPPMQPRMGPIQVQQPSQVPDAGENPYRPVQGDITAFPTVVPFALSHSIHPSQINPFISLGNQPSPPLLGSRDSKLQSSSPNLRPPPPPPPALRSDTSRPAFLPLDKTSDATELRLVSSPTGLSGTELPVYSTELEGNHPELNRNRKAREEFLVIDGEEENESEPETTWRWRPPPPLPPLSLSQSPSPPSLERRNGPARAPTVHFTNPEPPPQPAILDQLCWETPSALDDLAETQTLQPGRPLQAPSGANPQDPVSWLRRAATRLIPHSTPAVREAIL